MGKNKNSFPKITKLHIILIAIAIALVFPYFKDWLVVFIAPQPIPVQFVIANLVPSLVILYIIQKSINDWSKAVGILALVYAVGLITPSYHLLIDGSISNAILSGATFDALLAWFWSLFGVSGYLLNVLVYPVSFVLLIVLSLELLGISEFVRKVKG